MVGTGKTDSVVQGMGGEYQNGVPGQHQPEIPFLQALTEIAYLAGKGVGHDGSRMPVLVILLVVGMD
jgi:hypothetical protein